MTSVNWRRLEQLFASLVDQDPAARAVRLEEIGEDDPGLRSELEGLLAQSEAPAQLSALVVRLAGEAAAGLIEANERSADELATELLGSTVDAYSIDEVLGEGGFGLVYRATQSHPVSREVALKVIKRGLNSAAVIRRFELELQALAAMSHPAIAQVFDAGRTEDGRPYFVMELVDGQPITRYAAERELSTDERLSLFREVCAGVQHAHQRGVLHRDLKPSNLLVSESDGAPQVKIIDFGIAKALHGPLESTDQLTERRQIVGTLEYMSPEQASFEAFDIDVRSDVYSLGVLAYELLTGSVPFPRRSLEEVGLDEAIRIVREAEPMRPSMRVARLRQSQEAPESSSFTSEDRLRGDLDWILLKALEKNRDRRYEGVGALIADIERHLSHLPVEAGPPSTTYRLGKFYRRHRGSVLAAGLVLVALTSSLVVSVVSLNRVSDERDRALRAEASASQEAERTRQISDFLIELFEVSDPELAQGREIPAREILDRGALRVADLAAQDPDLAAPMLTALGGVYANLGLFEDAGRLLEKARDLQLEAEDSEASELALAMVWMHQNRLKEAEALARESLRQRRKRYGPRSLEAADALAALVEVNFRSAAKGQLEDIEETLSIRRELLGKNHPDVAASLSALARYRGWYNEWEESTALYKEASEIQVTALGNLHPRTLATQSKLVHALAYLRQAESAKALADDVVARARQVFGPTHPTVGDALTNRGSVHYRATRDYEAGLADFEAAIEILTETFPSAHPRVNEVRRRKGFILSRLERHEEALALQEAVLAFDIEHLGPSHNTVRRQHFNIGMAAQSAGRHPSAIKHFNQNMKYGEAKDWRPTYLDARAMHQVAVSKIALGEFAEAEELLVLAHRLLVEKYGEEYGEKQFAVKLQVEQLILLYEAWGKPQEKATWQAKLERLEALEAQAKEASAFP